MTTLWTLPTSITQYAESGAEDQDISWDQLDNIKNTDNRAMQSNGNLIHTARSPKLDIRNKTYYVKALGFNFVNLPENITGIEARLTARRYGRATDDTIQLCLSGTVIGENQATRIIDPIKIYGGADNLWNTENLSIEDVQDSSFGIVFRFQAHPDWPHKDPVLVDSVELRIH